MILIVGLGNPGIQYQNTRHNLGFRVLDLLAGGEKFEHKYDCEILKTDSVILAKPQLFMNNSGKAVSQILKFYPDAELIVIHDDIDFPLGAIKIMKNISSAGHKGVASIIDELQTKNFVRIRLGVNNPDTRGQLETEDYVLQKFTKEEETTVTEVLEKTLKALKVLQTEGLEIAQSRFNG